MVVVAALTAAPVATARSAARMALLAYTTTQAWMTCCPRGRILRGCAWLRSSKQSTTITTATSTTTTATIGSAVLMAAAAACLQTSRHPTAAAVQEEAKHGRLSAAMRMRLVQPPPGAQDWAGAAGPVRATTAPTSTPAHQHSRTQAARATAPWEVALLLLMMWQVVWQQQEEEGRAPAASTTGLQESLGLPHQQLPRSPASPSQGAACAHAGPIGLTAVVPPTVTAAPVAAAGVPGAEHLQGTSCSSSKMGSSKMDSRAKRQRRGCCKASPAAQGASRSAHSQPQETRLRRHCTTAQAAATTWALYLCNNTSSSTWCTATATRSLLGRLLVLHTGVKPGCTTAGLWECMVVLVVVFRPVRGRCLALCLRWSGPSLQLHRWGTTAIAAATTAAAGGCCQGQGVLLLQALEALCGLRALGCWQHWRLAMTRCRWLQVSLI